MQHFFLVILMLAVGSSCTSDSKELIFSDDFENHVLNEEPAPPWKKSGAGEIIVDTSKSYSGKQSLHLISGEGYKNRAFLGIYDKSIFPLINNAYYASMYVWVEEISPNGIHWTMLQSSGKVAGQSYSSEIRYGGQHHKQLMANYDTDDVTTDCWKHSSIALPERQWVKVGWFFDGNNNLMKLWLNDKPLDEITVRDRGNGCVGNDLEGRWKFPIFENVVIGWVDYQTNGGVRELWIDDFELSNGLPAGL